MKILSLILVFILISSCASLPSSWDKPGATPQELQKDQYECERDVYMLQYGPYDNPFAQLVINQHRQEMYDKCMKSKGWTRGK